METLIVDAPSPSSARAVGGFAQGSSTEVLRTSVSGRSPFSLHPAERRQDACVRHEHRANAEPDGASRLCDRPVDAGLPARHAADSVGRERLTARIPGAARAEEERDLDAVLCPERCHLRDLRVGQHHHARALRDPPHRHVAGLCLLEHGPQNLRPFDGRDLDPVPQAVRKARVAHRSHRRVIIPG